MQRETSAETRSDGTLMLDSSLQNGRGNKLLLFLPPGLWPMLVSCSRLLASPPPPDVILMWIMPLHLWDIHLWSQSCGYFGNPYWDPPHPPPSLRLPRMVLPDSPKEPLTLSFKPTSLTHLSGSTLSHVSAPRGFVLKALHISSLDTPPRKAPVCSQSFNYHFHADDSYAHFPRLSISLTSSRTLLSAPNLTFPQWRISPPQLSIKPQKDTLLFALFLQMVHRVFWTPLSAFNVSSPESVFWRLHLTVLSSYLKVINTAM